MRQNRFHTVAICDALVLHANEPAQTEDNCLLIHVDPEFLLPHGEDGCDILRAPPSRNLENRNRAFDFFSAAPARNAQIVIGLLSSGDVSLELVDKRALPGYAN